MDTKPATKRSVVLVVIMAAISVSCLAIATKGAAKKAETRKPPIRNFLIRALDWK